MPDTRNFKPVSWIMQFGSEFPLNRLATFK